ncbi:MAG: transposase [Pseudonocardiaceae bacterium]
MTFGALCRDCPLRAACTTAKTGRTMVLHERDDLLRAARADWAADPAVREDYRPNVERTVSRLPLRAGGGSSCVTARPPHHRAHQPASSASS